MSRLWQFTILTRGKHLRRGLEMHLAQLGKTILPPRRNQLAGNGFYCGRCPAWNRFSVAFSSIRKPVDKALARENRCSGNRGIGLGLGALLQLDGLPVLHQGTLDEPRVCKLVR